MRTRERPARFAITTLAWLLVIGVASESACSRRSEAPAARASPTAGLAASDRKARLLRTWAEGIEARGHIYLSTKHLEAELRETIRTESDASELFRAQSALSHLLVCRGEIDEAIALADRCVAHARAADLSAQERAWVVYELALARFRQAERANCITMHNEDSCIFPLRGGAIHQQPEGAREAVAALTEALDVYPDFPEAQWLLNVAHMALGTWPDGVPAPWRMATPTLPTGATSRFVESASRIGMDGRARAGGLAIDDFDGDGRLDVLTSSFDPSASLHLFVNRGAGRLEDVSTAAGLTGQLGALNFVHGDLDDDGRLDVVVLRGGALYRDGEIPNSLLRQVAPGRFADVTREAGIEIAAPTRTAALADIDADGDLDLFVGYDSLPRIQGGFDHPSRLYRNEGHMRFVEITASAGIANEALAVGAAFGDYDGDGDPDLYVSNYMAPNRLYRNDGRGRFEDVAVELGVTAPIASSVVWFFDYDNDGDEDLFAACAGAGSRERSVALYFRDGTVDCETMRLYESDGSGALRDVTEARGLRRVAFALGANFGDIDGDGYPDIYIGTGAESMGALWPNVMLRNERGRGFVDVTVETGLGHLQKSNGIAFADLDGDGDQDIGVNLGGYHLDDGFANALFVNPGASGRTLTLRLRGVRSNRSAIGARVHARITEAGQPRDVYATVGATGSFGGNSLQVELGVGVAEKVDRLEITWPASGRRTLLRDVPLGAEPLVIVEAGE